MHVLMLDARAQTCAMDMIGLNKQTTKQNAKRPNNKKNQTIGPSHDLTWTLLKRKMRSSSSC